MGRSQAARKGLSIGYKEGMGEMYFQPGTILLMQLYN